MQSVLERPETISTTSASVSVEPHLTSHAVSTVAKSARRQRSKVVGVMVSIAVALGLVIAGPSAAAMASSRPFVNCQTDGTFGWTAIGDDLVPYRSYTLQARFFRLYPPATDFGLGTSWSSFGSYTTSGGGVFSTSTFYDLTPDLYVAQIRVQTRVRDNVTGQIITGEYRSDYC